MISLIKKFYFKIKYKIWSYFYYKSPIYINFKFWKPISDWWKVKNIFKCPVFVFHKLKYNEEFIGSDYFYTPHTCYNKWLFIDFGACQYKLKYNEIRFESVPYIVLIWKQKITYIIGLETPEYEYSITRKSYSKNNLLYWEGILTYLHECNKDLYKTYNYNKWSTFIDAYDKEGNKIDINDEYNIIPYLKHKYQKFIISKLNIELKEKQDNENK